MSNVVSVKVSASLACFTRPEAKVERVSYMCMTPSAARGVLEAIVWKPEFEWVVHSIIVLRPIQFISIRRNEIEDTINVDRQVKGRKGVIDWMVDPATYQPYFADAQTMQITGFKKLPGNRAQRHTLALRDVAYVITAEPKLTSKANQARRKPFGVDEPNGPNTVAKYVCMFNRRVEKGQCFQQPYLGLREFVADFVPVTKEDQPDMSDSMLGHDRYDLGRMFFDFRYPQERDGRRVPLYAPAYLERGELNVDVMRQRVSTLQADGVAK